MSTNDMLLAKHRKHNPRHKHGKGLNGHERFRTDPHTA